MRSEGAGTWQAVRTVSSRLGAFFFCTLLIAGCATAPRLRPFPTIAQSDLPCVSETDDVTWLRPSPGSDRQTLDAWCTSVGPPFVHALPAPARTLDTVVVVTWNMNVGRGNLDHLLEYLEEHHSKDLSGVNVGMVLLLQEVYRRGPNVPDKARFSNTTPKTIRAGDIDIVSLAQGRGLSAVYVPSMRNSKAGAPPEDRGNAILSTEPLTDPVAIELPFGKQRRVAVAVNAAGIQFVSTHFDPGRDRVSQAEALAKVVLPASPATVVAGDLNAVQGIRDGTYRALSGRFAVEACGGNRTHAWPWRLELLFGGWVGRLDHIFTTLPDGQWSKQCTTVPHFFGSDHRPILLVLTRGRV